MHLKISTATKHLLADFTAPRWILTHIILLASANLFLIFSLFPSWPKRCLHEMRFLVSAHVSYSSDDLLQEASKVFKLRAKHRLIASIYITYFDVIRQHLTRLLTFSPWIAIPTRNTRTLLFSRVLEGGDQKGVESAWNAIFAMKRTFGWGSKLPERLFSSRNFQNKASRRLFALLCGREMEDRP